MTANWKSFCPGCFEDKGGAPICPRCGYDESEPRSPIVLPHRTWLQNQFLVGRVLGKPGGFGITYLAIDTGLDTRVAIKEYLPRELAGRDTGLKTVKPHSREDDEMFRFGLEQFLREARTLAKFDHMHLVRVRHVFEENGTAYLVMDYYDGVTLAEYLHRQARLSEKTALDILMPIMDGLREVHERNILHRDIKPQNIYITSQGRPILLDFGAARVAVGERSKSLSVVLTPGYAPFEQYHRKGDQGPWTDIYSCAAVLYQMVTGEVPPEAPERSDRDALVAPQKLAPRLSPHVAQAILRGLALKARERPQTIREFQDQLMQRGGVRPPPPPPPPNSQQNRSSGSSSNTGQNQEKSSQTGWILGAVGLLAVVLLVREAQHKESPPPVSEPEYQPTNPAPPPTRRHYVPPEPNPRIEPEPTLPISQNPDPEPPVYHSPPPPSGPEQSSHAVESVVRGYYAAVGRRDVANALALWKSPANPARLENLVRNTESVGVPQVEAVTVGADRAVVAVDVTTKARNGKPQRWQGNIELEPTNDERWGIVKMNLSLADQPRPTAPPPVPSQDSALNDQLAAMVRAYYAALDRNDVSTAAAMRKSVPKDFGALVQSIESFKVNIAYVQNASGSQVNVWVDVVGKTQNHAAQRYQGTVELEAYAGRWLIASLKNLKEVK